jgi:hypothetical protein
MCMRLTPGCGTLNGPSLVLPVSLLLKWRRSARGHCAGVLRQRAPGRPGKPPRVLLRPMDIWHVYSCHIPVISTWSVKDDLSALVSAHMLRICLRHAWSNASGRLRCYDIIVSLWYDIIVSLWYDIIVSLWYDIIVSLWYHSLNYDIIVHIIAMIS